ncbi:hypothetical protein TNCT_630431 [Trichonephila clavata]|uniref:Uncharacterized protein n=1 Tax=Trichonephila clavata TaxID=2740835 RepID=A0A8X6LW73_TRICU|nr:hypothetical protein TNCT_630431 [Trichonephila clavata]
MDPDPEASHSEDALSIAEVPDICSIEEYNDIECARQIVLFNLREPSNNNKQALTASINFQYKEKEEARIQTFLRDSKMLGTSELLINVQG